MRLFLRHKNSGDDTPMDMQARSPKTGLRYKDINLLGQMMKMGADLTEPRHVLYFLCFPNQEAAESAAVPPRAAGFGCTVSETLPEIPANWRLVCEQPAAVLTMDFVRDADDLFQGVADRLGGEYDGWESSAG